jgi:hypothetical protein
MHLSHYDHLTLALDPYPRIWTKSQLQAYLMLPMVQTRLQLFNVLVVPSQITLP